MLRLRDAQRGAARNRSQAELSVPAVLLPPLQVRPPAPSSSSSSSASSSSACWLPSTSTGSATCSMDAVSSTSALLVHRSSSADCCPAMDRRCLATAGGVRGKEGQGAGAAGSSAGQNHEQSESCGGRARPRAASRLYTTLLNTVSPICTAGLPVLQSYRPVPASLLAATRSLSSFSSASSPSSSLRFSPISLCSSAISACMTADRGERVRV